MESFTTYIVNLLKKEKLFAPQGGPIILSQARQMTTYKISASFCFFLECFSWYCDSLGGKRVRVLWKGLRRRREKVCSMVCFYGCFTEHWCSMDDVPAMGCSSDCGKSISNPKHKIYTHLHLFDSLHTFLHQLVPGYDGFLLFPFAD